MGTLNQELLDKLIASGARLPWIKKWLLDEVWTADSYQSGTQIEYLNRGEKLVNNFEALMASAADRIYSELLSPPDDNKKLFNVLTEETAVVVFDGLSLREIPIILKLAKDSGLSVSDIDCSLAAIPCETKDFVSREFECGSIGPSQLPNRGELKNRGIKTVYTSNITQGINIEADNSPLLVWSAFPDNTYSDSGSRFDSHFENIHVQFETAWMHTVQQIKGRKRIIITSDHGYIYFGSGMDAPRSETESRNLNAYFGNSRNMSLSEKPELPLTDDIVAIESHNTVMLKGRVKTRSTGQAATQLYKHGGLSLMEMLTPWVELEAHN